MATGGYHYPGFVYMAECGIYQKIGASIEPEKRVYKIRYYGPRIPNRFRTPDWDVKNTQLVHAIAVDDMNIAETLLHNHFTEQRLDYSEWFNLSSADIEWFKSLDSI